MICHWFYYANALPFICIILCETVCWLFLLFFIHSTKAISKVRYFEGEPLFKYFKPGWAFKSCDFLNIQSRSCFVSILNLAAVLFLLWLFSWYKIIAIFSYAFHFLHIFSFLVEWFVLLFTCGLIKKKLKL